MKLIGVVGGVGPEASNYFCELLIKSSTKNNDQDSIPFIHYSNPQIPDRTKAILGKGKDPTSEFIKSCKILEKAGADLLVIPCNTAHYFLPRIKKEVSTPILDILDLLINEIKNNKKIKKIGILATTGSIVSRIFQDRLNKINKEWVIPSKLDQKNLVMGAIYGNKGIKAGNHVESKELLNKSIKNLMDEGADAIILGCTEIPLVIKEEDFEINLYDPMQIAVREITKNYQNKGF